MGNSTFYFGSTWKGCWYFIPNKSFFFVGSLNIRKSNKQIIYTVGSVKDLMDVIIPHIDNYPLITKKWEDFILFKSAVELINKKSI